MKALIIIPIVVGSLCLVGGGVVFGVAAVKASKDNVTTTETYEITDSFTSFNIDIETEDFEIKLAQDGKAKIECVEKKGIGHSATVKDNILTIKQEDNRPWYDKIFNFDFKSTKITVYVKEKDFDNFTYQGSTGDVKLPDSVSFNNIDSNNSTGDFSIKCAVSNNINVRNSTGSINIENVECKNITLDTSTGSLHLKNVKAEELIKTHTSTGGVKFNDVKAKNIKHNSSTGGFNAYNTIIDEKMEIETSTGDIYFSSCDASEMYIKTSTGDVNGNFLTGKTFQTHTSTGHVDVPNTTGGICKVETSTGDIKLSVNE